MLTCSFSLTHREREWGREREKQSKYERELVSRRGRATESSGGVWGAILKIFFHDDWTDDYPFHALIMQPRAWQPLRADSCEMVTSVWPCAWSKWASCYRTAAAAAPAKASPARAEGGWITSALAAADLHLNLRRTSAGDLCNYTQHLTCYFVFWASYLFPKSYSTFKIKRLCKKTCKPLAIIVLGTDCSEMSVGNEVLQCLNWGKANAL